MSRYHLLPSISANCGTSHPFVDRSIQSKTSPLVQFKFTLRREHWTFLRRHSDVLYQAIWKVKVMLGNVEREKGRNCALRKRVFVDEAK